MTHRIYYTDPYCATFDARVTSTRAHEGRPAVVLDRTAFYPTSGGQPFDTGRLGDAQVVDVVDLEDAGVLHVLTAPLVEGAAVHGAIDWARRFDHMQQHTGQHILSAAFDRLFGARTISFHLGTDGVSIDLEKEMSADRIAEAEADANAVVWDDRPVGIRFVSASEAEALPLRKDPARTGALRLIDVENFDLSACGGTHVSRTGAVGLIAVTGSERFKGGTRLGFVCGGRALKAWRRHRDAVARSIQLLSVQPEELPAGIERSQQESRDLRKSLKELQEQLAVHEAARLLAAATTHGAAKLVVDVLDGWDANGLKAVAAAAVKAGGAAVALFSSPAPALGVIARSEDVTLDANAIVKALIDRFGGRGGGRPNLAQAGGFNADGRTLAAAARELVTGA